MFGSPPEVAAVGADFGSLARYDGNHAAGTEPPGQADLARLLRDRGRRPDGRQVDSICRPLPGGGIVATHREHRPSHDALIDPGLTFEALLQALDNATDGFQVWDRSEEHTSELQSLMRISY